MLGDGTSVTAEGLVLATDREPLQRLVADADWLGDAVWRGAIAQQRIAPSFAVWRQWLDRPAAQGARSSLARVAMGRSTT